MTALMINMMAPTPQYEDEFHDWYDTEHMPGRARLPGFLSANRFVCVEGWPRYAAWYDLESLDVLTSPAYQAVSGTNTSPWSRRLVPKTHGYFRALGVQTYPGGAVFGEKGACNRVLVLRFRAPEEKAIPDILSGLRALFDDRPQTVQSRLFRSEFGGLNYVAMVELRKPVSATDLDVSQFGEAAKCLDLVNLYQLYFRRGATPPNTY
jgi:hypothetical protein